MSKTRQPWSLWRPGRGKLAGKPTESEYVVLPRCARGTGHTPWRAQKDVGRLVPHAKRASRSMLPGKDRLAQA
ncbi:MAG: hypothetical protein ACUVXJ_00050 [Phycisphaerae bacterium]